MFTLIMITTTVKKMMLILIMMTLMAKNNNTNDLDDDDNCNYNTIMTLTGIILYFYPSSRCCKLPTARMAMLTRQQYNVWMIHVQHVSSAQLSKGQLSVYSDRVKTAFALSMTETDNHVATLYSLMLRLKSAIQHW